MTNKNKIVVIGPCKSGKTAVVERIINNTFNPNYNPTIGLSFGIKSHIYNDKPIQLEFWDISGDYRYQPLLKAYIKDSKIILIVINSEHSLTDLYNLITTSLEYSCNSSTKIYIIISKIDVSNSLNTDILEYAKSNSYDLFPISSQTGKGISDLYNNIINYIIHTEEKPLPLEDDLELNYSDINSENISKNKNINKSTNKCNKCQII